MFHMMNEARIAVGLGATMLGYAGYEASLAYAKDRPQGRPMGPSGKDATLPQIPIIRHADVKRMLLAQKSYCEGALALEGDDDLVELPAPIQRPIEPFRSRDVQF